MIKEKTCYVAINPSKEEKDTSRDSNDFVLPDGNIVKVNIPGNQPTNQINKQLIN